MPMAPNSRRTVWISVSIGILVILIAASLYVFYLHPKFTEWKVAGLWEQAQRYKEAGDCVQFDRVLKRITELDPQHVTAWRLLGWNSSFNLSSEPDDDAERYAWVSTGISQLVHGCKHNPQDARLLHDLAWFIAYKIGRSDDRIIHRVLFEVDEALHDLLVEELDVDASLRDNWLVAKSIFQRLIDRVEAGQATGLSMSEEFLYAQPAKCTMHLAEAHAEEGRIGEASRVLWLEALKEWEELGKRTFTGIGGSGESVEFQFSEFDGLEAEEKDLIKRLDDLGGVDEQGRTIRQRLSDAKRAKLRPEELRLVDTPYDDLTTEDEIKPWLDLKRRTAVNHTDVTAQLPAADREEGNRLVEAIERIKDRLVVVVARRSVVGYKFWHSRCQIEASEEGMAARRALYQADQHLTSGDRDAARKAYERAFALWRPILDQYPELATDGDAGLLGPIRCYAEVLSDMGEQFNQEQFTLRDVIKGSQPKTIPVLPPTD